MIDILSFNIYDTINYIKTDCTDADFAYASYGFGTADRYDIKLKDISDLSRALLGGSGLSVNTSVTS